jgi:hypothetical protein
LLNGDGSPPRPVEHREGFSLVSASIRALTEPLLWNPFIIEEVSDLITAGSVRAHFASPGRFTLAVAIGLAGGVVTEWSATHLPFTLEPLANSAAPWILVALAVALSARRMSESLALSVVTLLALVVGYYVAEAHRGWAVSLHQVELWSAASVAIGPLVGLAAGWLRNTGRIANALGAGVLGGLVAGEAVYGLTDLRFSTPAEYWHVQFVLGVGLAVGVTLWRSRRHLIDGAPAIAVALAAFTMIGLLTLDVYQVL